MGFYIASGFKFEFPISAVSDDCRDLLLCSECGWCQDYNLCVAGNKTGPEHGSCDWYYYDCSTTTTTTTTSTLAPTNKNTSWTTYGGNNQHSGYVDYSNTIDSSSNYTQFFEIDFETELGYYVSSNVILNNTIYFHTYRVDGKQSNTLLACYIFTSNILWSLPLNNSKVSSDYSSGPTVTPDEEYIVSLGVYSQNYPQPITFPTLVSLHTRSSIPADS